MVRQHATNHRLFLSSMQPQPLVILGVLALAFVVMVFQVLLQLSGASDFLTDVIALSILTGALVFAQVLDRRLGIVGAVLAGAVAAIVPGVPTIPPHSMWEMLVRLVAFVMMGTVYYVVILALRRRDERTQQQLADLRALYQEVRRLHAITDRAPTNHAAIHSQIAQAALRLSGAGRSRLVLADDEGVPVEPVAVWPPPTSGAFPPPLPIVPVPADAPYVVTPHMGGGKQISVALTGEHGAIGVLDVEQDGQETDARDIGDLLAVYAGDAGLILEHVALRERFDRLLLIEERARIARELHDGLVQSLGGIGYRLEYYRQTLTPDTIEPMLEELEATGIAIREALRDARQMIQGLRDPLSLEDVGTRLHMLLATVSSETEIIVSADLPDVIPPLSSALSDTIYAVAREALQNVVKHAAAESVSLALLVGPAFIELTISDDGAGFTHSDCPTQEAPPRFGLVGMTERAARHSGSLTVQTAPGMGTSVTLSLPLEEEERQ